MVWQSHVCATPSSLTRMRVRLASSVPCDASWCLLVQVCMHACMFWCTHSCNCGVMDATAVQTLLAKEGERERGREGGREGGCAIAMQQACGG